jgi:GNAT superfamily N-acetyltransferase
VAPPPELVTFANHHRAQPASGVEIVVTPRYQITLQPDFPIPGPNNVSWVRCRTDEAGDVIREARATIAPHRLPVMWTLDPETEPVDFADHLAQHGVYPDPHGEEAAVMVLSAEARLESPAVAGLELLDALADPPTFMSSVTVAAEAFAADSSPADPTFMATQERRRLNMRATSHRYQLLATVDGEPAGTGGLSIFAGGAIINGGSVRPKFRGRGVYRALVAARLDIARRAGVPGLAVWGGDMSAPILARLGFEKVGWRRFYVDTSTA